MDNKVLIAWVIGLVTRGIAWVLAAKLGMDSLESQSLAGQAANGIGAILLVAISVYSSVKGRKTLLATPPPK